MPVLTSTVIVRDDNFVSHVFLAGVEPPKWAVDKISNPDVWEARPSTKPSTPAAQKEPELEADNERVKIPPKAGRGSSAKAWAAYAADNGFAVESDATASEIREALQEQGVPTE